MQEYDDPVKFYVDKLSEGISTLAASAFDERNPAVKKMLKMAITACRKEGKSVGICGQGLSGIINSQDSTYDN